MALFQTLTTNERTFDVFGRRRIYPPTADQEHLDLLTGKYYGGCLITHHEEKKNRTNLMQTCWCVAAGAGAGATAR